MSKTGSILLLLALTLLMTLGCRSTPGSFEEYLVRSAERKPPQSARVQLTPDRAPGRPFLDSSMTEGQRKRLFDLLGAKGLLNENAKIAAIKEELNVRNLREVSESAADALMEKWEHERRYGDQFALVAASAGYVDQTGGKHPELNWWAGIELLVSARKIWRDWFGLPGDFRIQHKAVFSGVEGSFDAGGTKVKFGEDRIRLGAGPSWVIASEHWEHALEVNILGQWELQQGQARSDDVPDDKDRAHIPEIRLVYATQLPRLFQPYRRGKNGEVRRNKAGELELNKGYSALELTVNYNTDHDSEVYWARLRAKTTVWESEGTPGTGWERMLGRELSGDLPWASFRLGAEAEGFGGGAVSSWQRQGGGYAEFYSPKLRLSVAGRAGGGDHGLYHGLELWWGWSF